MDPALIAEIRKFKQAYRHVMTEIHVDYQYTNAFPHITAHLMLHGTLPPMDAIDTDSDGDSDDTASVNGYMSNPEFEDEEDDPEEEDTDLDDVPPGFDMEGWLADYEAEEPMHAPELNPEDDPSDSEPESEVDDPKPPEKKVTMMLPSWAPWHGHLANLQPNTYAYVEIAPIRPCPFKAQTQKYYMGPILILQACKDGYYTMDVPDGYATAFSNQVLYMRVSPYRPVDENRIISPNLDYFNEKTYDEVPVDIEPHYNPRGWQHKDPRWNVTWECYGLTDVTVERESTMKFYYPNLF